MPLILQYILWLNTPQYSTVLVLLLGNNMKTSQSRNHISMFTFDNVIVQSYEYM